MPHAYYPFGFVFGGFYFVINNSKLLHFRILHYQKGIEVSGFL